MTAADLPTDPGPTGPADHWADLRRDAEAHAESLRRPSVDAGDVTVVLVAHDGATWLPTVLEGLAAQTVPPARVVAVDTGSTDGSADLLEVALGHAAVIEAPVSTSYAEAVDLARDHLAATGLDPRSGWLWLLHDDSVPAPDALQRLLECAHLDPAAEVIGPKLREWPSLRRLLEVGVTVSGTARRETGLERGEYDQGQYAASRRVLAVNTAGMLVRPALLSDLGGLERTLPVLGADLDLGWRAAAAGRRTVVAPDAVVFHAEASHRGLRSTPLLGRHPHLADRRAALFVVLANCSTRAFLLQAVRLALGSLLRALGFLATRSPGAAADEVLAVAAVYARPGDLRRARRARRATRTVAQRDVRRLLAPWWVPYRHGLDLVGDVVSAATTHATDVADRRRDARSAAERDRVAATRTGTRAATVDESGGEDDELAAESGWLARYLTSPLALLLTAVVVLCLVGAREALGGIAGGALAPAPADTSTWWHLHAASSSPLGTGTDVPAPPYVAPLALLAWLLPGGPGATVALLMLLAVPFGIWGAWRLLGVAGRLLDPRGTSRWLLLVGAVTYGLVPVTSGAWAQGRFGIVVAAALLPWLAHAALGFADPERERRWRAGWRTGLLLTLVVALVPVAAVLALSMAVVTLAFGVVVARRALLSREVLRGTVAPVALALVLPAVLLSPWLLPTLLHGDLVALAGEAGRLPYPALAPLDVALGRLGDGAGTTEAGVVLVALAVLALAVPATRIAVVGCWAVAAAVLAPAALLALPTFDLAAGETPAALGLVVVVVAGAAVTAAVLGAQGLAWTLVGRRADGRPSAGAVRRVVAALPTLALAAVAVSGLAWFVGPGGSVAADDRDVDIPAYMAQRSETSPSYGVLLLRGSIDDGLTYDVRRDDGVRLGEEEVAALTPVDEAMAADVRALASSPTEEVVDRLRSAGIAYVVQPAPGDPEIRATLDSVAGLAPASAADPSTRAWELAEPPSADAVDDGSVGLGRAVLLLVQGVALVVVLVMAGPNRRSVERRSAPIEETR
ncbi:glycosyltransferase family 2 protein [Nocardioides alkalitolerans]|uniref:glycosyltransferase family 2 protein n=1 Tax=Nocardioides alkalitolerans TaxID=281714 RepID=UPI0003F54B06|nr:glycosyltransferase family 2 protein [Nocardioides alkalitolerans]